MIVFDLFEQDPNFRKPVEYENRKQYGTVNLANFIKAYQNNQPVQFDFPGGKSYKLTAQWVDMLADYYNTLETNNDKAQLVYDVLTDYNKTIRLLNELAQSKLFEKKSSEKSDNPDFKSTKLARLKTQARAKYPAASSDLEAMTADFVDSQEADQQEFEKVKATNTKQDELLKQITAINRQQDQEIDGLDSDNGNLQQNLQQLRAVNTELAKKLADMARRKSKDKEKTTATTSATSTSTAPTTAGSWVPPNAADTRPDWTTAAPVLAQPGIPTATPAMVGGEPATVLAKPKRKRRSKAEIDAEKASKAAMAAVTKAAGGAKIKPVQPNIPAAPTVGEPSAIPNTINLFPGVVDTEKPVTPQPSTLDVKTSNNVVDLFPEKLQKAAESINEADSIPLKSVVQGYNVEYNPKTRSVTVSRGGQVIGTGVNRLNSPKYHLTLINKIIDRAEEDKYPTDIDVRDVALPMKQVAEGSVFGQQDFDTQLDLAKLKSQLTQPKPAQSAPASAETQPVPARLSDLQSKHQKVANLADIKKTIETLQARATRGGRLLPRGLAADLEDYFTTTDIDTAYDDMMSKYQKQLGALQQYLGMRKALWSPKKDVHEMRAKELQENRQEIWTAYFTDGTKVTVTGVNDETDPARVRAFFAKKGKTVDRFDYGFKTGSDAVSKPEPHEPGSGTARSARTGEELPEDTVDRSGQKMYKAQEVYMLTHNGQEVAFYTLKDLKSAEQDAQDMQKKLGGEVHLRKVMRESNVININRGGHNAFRDRADWLDKRDYVQQQLLDPKQRDNYPELKQRLLDINDVGRKLGYTK
jgi:hypothetical protein